MNVASQDTDSGVDRVDSSQNSPHDQDEEKNGKKQTEIPPEVKYVQEGIIPGFLGKLVTGM